MLSPRTVFYVKSRRVLQTSHLMWNISLLCNHFIFSHLIPKRVVTSLLKFKSRLLTIYIPMAGDYKKVVFYFTLRKRPSVSIARDRSFSHTKKINILDL